MKRNSSIELLRILCIFGILLMHTFGTYYSAATGTNLIYGLIINSLFNSCVSIFFLISGYYGIKYSRKKVIKFWIIIFFYSLIEIICKMHISNMQINFDVILQLFLPLTFNKYWFMTTYIIILIFSNYINDFADKMSKSEFKKNIIVLLLIFSILPTFTKYQFLADSGKGIINMTIIYLIGRYLNKYPIKISMIKLMISLFITFLIEFFLNYKETINNGGIGVIAPYARDYSIFIIGIAIFIFLIFNKLKFYNKVINFVASGVLMVYLIDPIFRYCFTSYKDVSYWINSNQLPIYLILYSMVIFIFGIIFDYIRKKILGKIETKLTNAISKLIESINNRFIA